MKLNGASRYTILFSRLLAALIISTGLLIAAGCSSNNDSSSSNKAANSGQQTGSAAPASANQGNVKDNTNPYEVAGIADPQAFNAMFDKLKTAVASGDKEAVADLILFPLRVNGKGSALKITTREEFLKQYDTLFTEPIKKALANQSKDTLFVNYQGVMVGNGELWLGGDISAPQRLGIITINHDIKSEPVK